MGHGQQNARQTQQQRAQQTQAEKEPEAQLVVAEVQMVANYRYRHAGTVKNEKTLIAMGDKTNCSQLRREGRSVWFEDSTGEVHEIPEANITGVKYKKVKV